FLRFFDSNSSEIGWQLFAYIKACGVVHKSTHGDITRAARRLPPMPHRRAFASRHFRPPSLIIFIRDILKRLGRCLANSLIGVVKTTLKYTRRASGMPRGQRD